MSELFDKYCPVYMAYGMTYDEYWHGDPRMVEAFREAHLLRLKEQNMMAYYSGVYTYRAFETVLANAFSKPGTPPHKYLEKPLDIFPKTKEEQEAEEEQELQRLVASLNSWKKAWDNQYPQ